MIRAAAEAVARAAAAAAAAAAEVEEEKLAQEELRARQKAQAHEEKMARRRAEVASAQAALDAQSPKSLELSQPAVLRAASKLFGDAKRRRDESRQNTRALYYSMMSPDESPGKAPSSPLSGALARMEHATGSEGEGEGGAEGEGEVTPSAEDAEKARREAEKAAELAEAVEAAQKEESKAAAAQALEDADRNVRMIRYRRASVMEVATAGGACLYRAPAAGIHMCAYLRAAMHAAVVSVARGARALSV